MAHTVKEERYLGLMGWTSCMERYELRERELIDSKWGYWLLLRDVVEIGRCEDKYIRRHGELPQVAAHGGARNRERLARKEACNG